MKQPEITSPQPADADVSSATDAPRRADLQALQARHALTLDAQRPEAVAKRHALGMRTARENVDALCDPGSFVEYGALAIAAQRSRRSLDDLVRNTPADGMITGIGAIDADAADKAARFLQLCDVHGLPLVSLVDTPGFMVGPEMETRAQVRHVGRMFLQAAHLRVPFFAVVLRKGYGLGAMAMAGGSFHAPMATVAWPSGEFGGMGLEGAVRLGFRKELAGKPEGPEREALFVSLVEQAYERGKAINMASALEIDAVIDPADTRDWLSKGLAAARVGEKRSRPVDSW